MNWYIAKLVFRITSENTSSNALSAIQEFDEQVRLVEAYTDHQAFIKARQIGVQEQEIFMNASQKPVKWEFVNVTELNKIKNLKDGTELLSDTKEVENVDEYTAIINRRAEIIQSRTLAKELTTVI